jgi:hypothetical protein
MANYITGRVIAVSAVQRTQPKDASKQPIEFKQLFIDCTRFDPYTGERSQFENTPLLDFQGENMKLLDNIKENDIVQVAIDITGRKYTDEGGQMKVFNSIRPYQLRKLERQGAVAASPTQQAAPAQQAAPTQQAMATTQTGTDDLPF